MSLQSAIEAELPSLRAEAEARMVSTAVVRRPTGSTTTDADGYEVPEWDDVHTDLPVRIGAGSSGDGGSRGVTIGAVTFEQATAIAHFPAATDDLEDGDLIDVTSGEWEGDVYRIVATIRYDQKTARRLPIVETQRPEEWA